MGPPLFIVQKMGDSLQRVDFPGFRISNKELTNLAAPLSTTVIIFLGST
jgi:hypothetical protein